MGKCLSSFSAKFTPNETLSYGNSTADIVMKPVENDNIDKSGDSVVKLIIKPADEENNEPCNGENANQADLETVDVDVKSQPLIVEFVDLCVNENTKAHHTNLFKTAKKDLQRLILRRGNSFTLNIILNRPYNLENDILCIIFTAKNVRNPSYSQGTEVTLPVLTTEVEEHSSQKWYISKISSDENNVTVQIVPATNVVVGEWSLEVDSKNKEDFESPHFHYKVKEPIIILFNPWNKNDTVYLSDEELRKEYILNETGLIWRGNYKQLRPCAWNYAQFEENVLECCLYILTQIGRLSAIKRADPVYVIRHISAVLNSHDDNGILLGDWSGRNKAGLCPANWCSSRAILQKYYKTKKPVKYGQCWVFSGVFTTVCRALGIPSRSITNFSSAHATHGSNKVDCYFDCDGRPIDKLNVNSVWKYHAWNEVWMLRPDLEPGNYGGWQAVDSTPQEMSDGIYQCGPASVAAIKRGEVMKAFDTQFLYSEVNAVKVYWKYFGPKQPLKLIRKSTEEIGRLIVTKTVGKFESQDITEDYMQIEKRKEEGDVLLNALKQCKNSFSRYYINDDFEDVKFDFQLLEDISIGEPFSVTLKALNKRRDDQEYNIKVCLRVECTSYTNSSRKLVKRDDFETVLGPGAEQMMTMNVTYSDYQKGLLDQSDFLVTANAHVIETEFDYYAQDDFRVRMPDIKIQIDGEASENQPLTTTVYFTNPLPKVLNHGFFVLEGAGFETPFVQKCKKSIKVGADARASCKLIPLSSGNKVIIAKFQSKELNDVDGYVEIYVKPSLECDKKDNNSHL